MEVDDIISYHDLVTEEKAALQKGMNYGVGRKYSIFDVAARERAVRGSLTAANVRLLCAKHNLEKSDKILSIAPWIFAGGAAAPHIHKFPGLNTPWCLAACMLSARDF
jgi:hypothetical protein